MVKVSIDRVEDGIAVCITENGGRVLALVSRLPEGAAEGSVLRLENGSWTLCAEETERIRKELFALQESLFDA